MRRFSSGIIGDGDGNMENPMEKKMGNLKWKLQDVYVVNSCSLQSRDPSNTGIMEKKMEATGLCRGLYRDSRRVYIGVT